MWVLCFSLAMEKESRNGKMHCYQMLTKKWWWASTAAKAVWHSTMHGKAWWGKLRTREGLPSHTVDLEDKKERCTFQNQKGVLAVWRRVNLCQRKGSWLEATGDKSGPPAGAIAFFKDPTACWRGVGQWRAARVQPRATTAAAGQIRAATGCWRGHCSRPDGTPRRAAVKIRCCPCGWGSIQYGSVL